MKKAVVLIFLLLVFDMISFSQTGIDQSSLDNDFLKAYTVIAFNPGRDGKSFIRKWQSDVKLFVQNSNATFYEEELGDFIQKLNDCISIKISFTNLKNEANCVILIDTTLKTRTHYELSWDGYGNIYKAKIIINNESIFNTSEQIATISQYLMMILGDFHLPDKYSSTVLLRQTKVDTKSYEEFEKVKSILKSKLFGLTDFDCNVLKFHYSKNITAGLAKEDFWPSIKNVLQ